MKDKTILDLFDDFTIHIFMSIEKLLPLIPTKYHNMIMTFHNKLTFCNFMMDNGLHNHIPQLLEYPPKYFPCIVKPHMNMSGSGIEIIHHLSDWYKKRYKFDQKSHLIQRYIVSPIMYSCHIVAKGGVLMIGKVYYTKKPKKFHVHHGPITNYTSRDLNEKETNLFSQILKLNNYHGACDFDYEYDEIGVIKIFEINPRFGGSLIHNKNDFVMFLKVIVDNKINYD